MNKINWQKEMTDEYYLSQVVNGKLLVKKEDQDYFIQLLKPDERGTIDGWGKWKGIDFRFQE